jgi:hypothetical protein
MSPRKKQERLPGPEDAPGTQALRRRLGDLREFLSSIPLPPTRRCLTYEDVIGWLVDNRPDDDAACQAGVLRAPSDDGRIEVTLVYLNRAGEVVIDKRGKPCGRKLIVDELDNELAGAFGKDSLIIVN